MSNTEKAKEVVGYLIGQHIGGSVIPQIAPGVEAVDICGETLLKGILDAMSGKRDAAYINADIDRYQKEFFMTIHARQQQRGSENLEKGRQYMEANGKRPEVTTTASGLQYEVMVAAEGETYDAAKHGEAPKAKVMYKGMLIDGTVFDQSSQPVEFNIRQVIPGFTEALTTMPVGSKWKVTIPANLAYGANGPGKIGPNSTLIFEMELLALTK